MVYICLITFFECCAQYYFNIILLPQAQTAPRNSEHARVCLVGLRSSKATAENKRYAFHFSSHRHCHVGSPLTFCEC